MYFVTATHYLTGIAPGLLLFVPALEIFFDLRPVSLGVGPLGWFAFYAGFYVLQILLATLTLGTFRWEVLMLAQCSFPIYLRALRNAFIGADTKWSVTGAVGRQASPFNFMIPQVLVWVFLICTTIVSVLRDLNLGYLNVATVWNALNLLALTAFVAVAFGELRHRRGTRQFPTVPDAVSLDTAVPPVMVEVLDRSSIQNAQAEVDALLAGESPPEREPRTLSLTDRPVPGDGQFGVMPTPIRRGLSPEPPTASNPEEVTR